MKILMAGPIDVQSLSDVDGVLASAPPTYSFPLLGSLIRGYLRHGHEVSIVTQSVKVRRPVHLGERLKTIIVPRRTRAVLRAVDMFRVEQASLSRAYAELQPEVIHAHWLYEFAASALDSGFKSVITAHDSPVILREQFSTYYWRRRAKLGDMVLARSPNLTAVSPEIAEQIAGANPLNPIRIIANGIPPGSVCTDAAFSNSFVMVANGFDDRKNTRAGFRAFARYRDLNPSSTLHVFGAGHEPSGAAARWLHQERKSEGVVLHGAVPNDVVLSFLSTGGHVLIHTSRWEGNSVAMLEAMRAGIPVIAGSSSGGTVSTLGGAGKLVDVTDISAICGAMLALSQPTEYKNASSRSRDRVRRQFSEDAMIREYLDAMSGVVASD